MNKSITGWVFLLSILGCREIQDLGRGACLKRVTTFAFLLYFPPWIHRGSNEILQSIFSSTESIIEIEHIVMIWLYR